MQKITPVKKEPEMSAFESGFVCGLIRKYTPHKIVEIGVAAGGTTSIVLQCMDMLNYQYEMYSIDYSQQFYRGKKKRTGFMAEEAKKYMKNPINHTFYLGNVSPAFLEDIGSKIDFVIIDTMHVLPGELLDFLVIFPYLSSEAIVVLHDITYNHKLNNPQGFATKILLDTVVGNKIMIRNHEQLAKEGGYPNIGAFQITKDTARYIENCFSVLTITWTYMPDSVQLKTYRDKLKEKYCSEYLELFDMAVELNQRTLNNLIHKKLSFYGRIRRIGRVLLYGY